MAAEPSLSDFWESLSEFDEIIKKRSERPPTRLHVGHSHYSEAKAGVVVSFVLCTPTLDEVKARAELATTTPTAPFE